MNNTIKGKITIPTIKGTIPGTSYTQSSSDYEVLTNKPQINGVELLGNKTTSDLGIESFSGDYNDLTNKPSIPSKTSELTNDSGFITSSALGGYVPTSRTINSKALTNNITLSASDVGALSSSTTYVSSVNGSSGAITGLQTTSNLSTSIDETSTDTEYPSAKVVYDSQVEQNEKIEELERYKTIYNVLPKVEDEGEALTLSDTGNATLKLSLKGNTTQNGTPTPDAPVEVETTIGDNTINIVGKNLCNGITQNYYINQAATRCGYETGDSGLIIEVDGVSDYTISSNTTQIRYRVGCLNETPVEGGSTTIVYNGSNKDGTNDSVTINTNGYKYLVVNATNLTAIQIEKGSQATTYEPYQSQTYEINLGDIELCKIGNYQDRIYKDSGKWYIEKQIGKVVLDGSEKFTSYQYDNSIAMYKDNSLLYIKGQSSYCDKFSLELSSISNMTNGEYRISVVSNNTYILFKSEETSNISAFKTWLSTHNITCYYVLATPTTTEITDTTLISQLDELESAMSYKGQTNISQINNDAPFIISASALYDLNNLVTRVAVLETE